VDEKRQSSWEGEQWILAQEKEKSEGDKNRNKEIVILKLIIQEKQNTTKNTGYRNNKKFDFW
jgi:hypothetical protein